mmetsp:Transcript_7766/g.25803  ORF Transcript_7766/g.25803 Transcript_7766/m.25803 type:complete len:215 (-) Transcript_7766:539-1183(-)
MLSALMGCPRTSACAASASGGSHLQYTTNGDEGASSGRIDLSAAIGSSWGAAKIKLEKPLRAHAAISASSKRRRTWSDFFGAAAASASPSAPRAAAAAAGGSFSHSIAVEASAAAAAEGEVEAVVSTAAALTSASTGALTMEVRTRASKLKKLRMSRWTTVESDNCPAQTRPYPFMRSATAPTSRPLQFSMTSGEEKACTFAAASMIERVSNRI